MTITCGFYFYSREAQCACWWKSCYQKIKRDGEKEVLNKESLGINESPCYKFFEDRFIEEIFYEKSSSIRGVEPDPQINSLTHNICIPLNRASACLMKILNIFL